MIKHDDKRAFQRLLINSEVAITHNDKTAYGICRDLSAGGMGLAVSELSLAVGDSVTISLCAEGVPPFKAVGEVVRAEGNEYALSFSSVE